MCLKKNKKKYIVIFIWKSPPLRPPPEWIIISIVFTFLMCNISYYQSAALKLQITKQRQDKVELQKQLARIRREFTRLKQGIIMGFALMDVLGKIPDSRLKNINPL